MLKILLRGALACLLAALVLALVLRVALLAMTGTDGAASEILGIVLAALAYAFVAPDPEELDALRAFLATQADD